MTRRRATWDSPPRSATFVSSLSICTLAKFLSSMRYAVAYVPPRHTSVCMADFLPLSRRARPRQAQPFPTVATGPPGSQPSGMSKINTTIYYQIIENASIAFFMNICAARESFSENRSETSIRRLGIGGGDRQSNYTLLSFVLIGCRGTASRARGRRNSAP